LSRLTLIKLNVQHATTYYKGTNFLYDFTKEFKWVVALKNIAKIIGSLVRAQQRFHFFSVDHTFSCVRNSFFLFFFNLLVHNLRYRITVYKKKKICESLFLRDSLIFSFLYTVRNSYHLLLVGIENV